MLALTLHLTLLLSCQEELDGAIQLRIQVGIGVLSSKLHYDVGFQPFTMDGVVVGCEPARLCHTELSTVAQFVHQLD